jgi:hypothetical protein
MYSYKAELEAVQVAHEYSQLEYPKVELALHSISDANIDLTTWVLEYPRYIHAEFMTHRVFSRNASSSRAIPVKKIIERVWNDPVIPISWGGNKPGMQAGAELQGMDKVIARKLWIAASRIACTIAKGLVKVNLHKQIANRILEPFSYIKVIMTTTELENWFDLRYHPDAQPEIQELARRMFRVIEFSTPKLLVPGQWHLPFVKPEELIEYELETCKKICSARNARVSYLNHDGSNPNVQKDIGLHDDLVSSKPIHASPTEHPATPDTFTIDREGNIIWDNPHLHGNFVGWIQYRKQIEAKLWGAKRSRKSLKQIIAENINATAQSKYTR